jgi:parvulin-like peptidyl-prolyl isomerase
MSEIMHISSEEIIHQIKLSGQIPSILEGIATRKLIRETAAEVGIQVEDEELQEAADQLRYNCGLQQTKDTYAWLQKQGLTIDEFEEMIDFTVLSGKLAQHLFANQVEPYFLEHQLEHMQIALYEVVLEDEELAQELYFAIREREMSFFDVAQQYTQDEELRRKGGYLGLVNRSHLKPEISAAIFAVEPPKLLEPILTAKGVHLIRVESIIQPQLDLALRQSILLDLFTGWIKSHLELGQRN